MCIDPPLPRLMRQSVAIYFFLSFVPPSPGSEALEELGLPIPDPAELEYLFTVVSSAKGSSLKFGPFLDNEYQVPAGGHT